jgi:hypothetical protein
MKTLPFGALATIALLTISAPSYAQSAEDKATATALFEQARALASGGKYAEACPKFAESLRLQPGLGTMLWLADCYESNGQTASAWAQFKEASSLAALRHDKREEVARTRVAALEGKLVRLNIVVPSESAMDELSIERDGDAVPKAQWGLELPIDPGEHTIRASAPGMAAWTTTVRLATPGPTTVTVPSLQPAVVPPAVGSAPPVEAPDAVPAPPRGAMQRTLGLVSAGAGLVGIGLGTYFGLHAKSTYDASNTGGHCIDNVCDVTGDGDRSDARAAATGSTIAFIAGVAALSGGAVLFFMAPRDAKTPTTALTPTVGRDGATLVLTVTW